MKRRNLNPNTYLKRLGTQVIFISVMTMGAFIRIYTDTSGDMNTTIFATILAFGIILGLSIYNIMVIRFSETFNEKFRVLNYCFPTVPLAIFLLVFDFPNRSDVYIFLTLTLASNLAGYYFLERPKETTTEN